MSVYDRTHFRDGDWVVPTYKYSYLGKNKVYQVLKVHEYRYLDRRCEVKLRIEDDFGKIRDFNPKNFKLNTCYEVPPKVANSNDRVAVKSCYVIVNQATGVVVRSSGEVDRHFNSWTNETLREWLQAEVSGLLRASPSSKFDVYSYEMTGQLPTVTIDWVSK